jgi:hypothetical protein
MALKNVRFFGDRAASARWHQRTTVVDVTPASGAASIGVIKADNAGMTGAGCEAISGCGM